MYGKMFLNIHKSIYGNMFLQIHKSIYGNVFLHIHKSIYGNMYVHIVHILKYVLSIWRNMNKQAFILYFCHNSYLAKRKKSQAKKRKISKNFPWTWASAKRLTNFFHFYLFLFYTANTKNWLNWPQNSVHYTYLDKVWSLANY